MGRRRYRGSVTVDVDIEDVLSEMSDRDIREEFEARFGGPAVVDFDLLSEVQAELLGGRINYALALVESALCARRVTDQAKLEAYEAAARAH